MGQKQSFWCACAHVRRASMKFAIPLWLKNINRFLVQIKHRRQFLHPSHPRNASKDEIWCVWPGGQLCLWSSLCYAYPGPPSSMLPLWLTESNSRVAPVVVEPSRLWDPEIPEVQNRKQTESGLLPCGESDCDLDFALLIIPPGLPAGRQGVCQVYQLFYSRMNISVTPQNWLQSNIA